MREMRDDDAYLSDAVEWRMRNLAIQRVQALFRHYRHSLDRGGARLHRWEEQGQSAQKILTLRKTIQCRKAWLAWHEGDLQQEIHKNDQLGSALETRKHRFLERGMNDPAEKIVLVEKTKNRSTMA